MALSSIGDGGVHNGGSFGNVGFTTGLILPYLERLFGGQHSLLRVLPSACGSLIIFYACGFVITRADMLLRVRILICFNAM